MPSTLTICIPAFKSNKVFLLQAIDSVINQTVGGWKLFVVDGNIYPDDALKLLVDGYNDNRIHYTRNNNDTSMAGNWNFAFSLAKTELVTLLHDDDYLSHDYVENMVKLAHEFPDSSMYFCDVNLVDENGKNAFSIADHIKSWIKPKKECFHLVGDNGLANLLAGCFIFCPTICYRKGSLAAIPFLPRWQMVTDFQLYLDVLLDKGTITGTSGKYYYYRRHNQNQTAKLTSNLQRFEEESALYNEIACLPKAGWKKSVQKAESKTMIKLHLIFLICKNMVSLNVNQSKQYFLFLISLFK